MPSLWNEQSPTSGNAPADFAKAPNQGLHPELYEIENAAIDHDDTLWHELIGAAPWAGKRIVDLGCGTGYWLPRYAADAREVIGIEPDAALLPAARARSGGATVLRGSAEHIPLPGDSVDVVHARFAYFFPSDENDCDPGLDEVMRVLRPGGSLVVIDNDQRRGEFADLLAESSWADAQGEGRAIHRWWADRGAETNPVMSSWSFDSRADLAAVLRMEFPSEVAGDWLARHPDATGLSYGYLLHLLTAPAGTAAPRQHKPPPTATRHER
ncbi:class I SAM-dependent methyltransferase [Spelaeicoccus albus]|uniref:Ubiquinone/menaquinone biosynthesis C-methylase UbiE n=1 Tax=Spelaeicoccus albus TaxID=1280376 RepID=A0A7Z0D2V4_9MICO|nr:class I SAM-dependent methyltransferase [Spelaeicoccus albus]NYI67857.1 ubiquinone/menaquinone biosynthesis C-methylase UbiE [Spelaeicoccus albus]